MDFEKHQKHSGKISNMPSDDRKASGLQRRTFAKEPEKKATPKRRLGSRRSAIKAGANGSTRRRVQIWVDIVMVFVVGGLIAGGVIGYGRLKDRYLPEVEMHNVVFMIEFSDIDTEALPGSWHTVPAYLSDGETEMEVARLREVPLIIDRPSDGEKNLPPRKIVRCYLEAKVEYREYVGYSIGTLPLLAGKTYHWRVDGIASPATILAVYEKDEYEARISAAGSEP